MILAFSLMPMTPGQSGPPGFLIVLFPFLYLIMGYLTAAVGCLIYNGAYKYIGGIEYETSDVA